VVIVWKVVLTPRFYPGVQIEIFVHVEHGLESRVVKGNTEVEYVGVGIKDISGAVDGFRSLQRHEFS